MGRRIRIAFAVSRYHSLYGAQKSLLTLVANLSERIEPIVLLPGDGVLGDAFREAGAEVEIIPLRGKAGSFGGEISRLSRFRKVEVATEILAYNWRVARWLKERRIDLVYANDLRALMCVGLASRLAGRPCVWYVRGDNLPSRLLARVGVRLASRVILIADGVKAAFPQDDLARYGSKFHVLHTGFEFSALEPECLSTVRQSLGLSEETPLIGMVGSITPRKGCELLIQALADVVADGIDGHLLVVGDAPVGYEEYKEALMSAVERLGMSPRVHWVGFQPNVEPFYQAMDVLVLPSRSEGLPRVVVEALSYGVPVVATDVGGTKDIVVEYRLGRVIPPNDVRALVTALKAVLNDRQMYSPEMRNFRRHYVRERFGLEAYVRGFEGIAETLVRSERKYDDLRGMSRERLPNGLVERSLPASKLGGKAVRGRSSRG